LGNVWYVEYSPLQTFQSIKLSHGVVIHSFLFFGVRGLPIVGMLSFFHAEKKKVSRKRLQYIMAELFYLSPQLAPFDVPNQIFQLPGITSLMKTRAIGQNSTPVFRREQEW